MKWLSRLLEKAKRPVRTKASSRSFRPTLEALEDRQLLTIAAPVLLGPSGPAPPNTLTFTWDAVDGASYYNFNLNNLTRNTSISGNGLTTTSITLGAPLFLGDTYQWTVQAVDGAGNLGYLSNPYTLQITNITAPTPIGPTGPAAPQPQFSWNPVSGAAHYDVYFQNQQTGVAHEDSDVGGTTFTPAPLAQGYTYIWWVRAVDTNGIPGPWCSPLTFSESVLPAPTVIGPNGNTSLDPTFSWNATSGADHYDVYLQDMATNQVTENTNVTGTSWTPGTSLTLQDTYDWWVRAINAQGYKGQWSAAQSITPYAVAAPTPIGPTGTAGTLPTFSWNAVAGANLYDIYIADTNTKIVQRDQSVSGTSYVSAQSLTPGDTYNWWVRGINSSNVPGAWSSQQTFTAYPLGTVSLIGPTGTSTTLPTFSWNAVTGASHYYIWVQDMKTGAVLSNANVTGLTWAPAGPLNQGDTYDWWVRAINSSGQNGGWSTDLSFTVPSLAAPVLIGPANGLTGSLGSGSTSVMPTFTWNAVTGANVYDIWVQDMKTGKIVRDQSVSGTSWTPASSLTAGDPYEWWVRAIDANNSPGPWSAGLKFTA